MLQPGISDFDLTVLTMADDTRLIQLQDGSANLIRSTYSQFKTVEAKMLALKRQLDAIVQ